MNQTVTNATQPGFSARSQQCQVMGAPIAVPIQLITNSHVNVDTSLQQKYLKILRSLGVSVLVVHML